MLRMTVRIKNCHFPLFLFYEIFIINFMQLKGVISHLFHPKKSNNHRPKILHPEAYVFFILVLLGFYLALRSLSLFGFSHGWILGFSSSITPEQVIEQTNQQRRTLGLSDLTLNQQLTNAALAKAQHMFSNQYWAHTSPDGVKPWNFIRDSGYTYKVAGENLARDFSNTADMMSAWMASPTHRDNIVNSKYQEIGIAVVDGELLGYETTLVVQMFGTKLTATPQVSDDSQAIAVNPAVKAASVPEVAPEAVTQQEALKQEEQTEPTITSIELTGSTDDMKEQVVVKSPERLSLNQIAKPLLFSPLQLVKAFFLAIILMIILTLTYDLFIISNTNVVRLVGKNLAHMMLLISISFLLLFFKGGMIQ